MHVALAGHRHQERQLVDDLGLMRKDTAHPAAAFTVLSKRKRALHHSACLSRKTFRLFLRAKHLPVQPCQFGLVIKGIHGACAAIHKQLNDPLGLRWMMQASGPRPIAVSTGCTVQPAGSSQSAEPASSLGKKPPSAPLPERIISCHGAHSTFAPTTQSTKRNSLLFNRRRQTAGIPCCAANSWRAAASSADGSRSHTRLTASSI